MELTLILELLCSFKLNDENDIYSWSFHNSGIFSMKSFYIFINNGGSLCPFSSYIWKLIALLKVKIFVWLSIHNWILTVENLLKRNWYGSSQGCSLCGSPTDSTDHLFLQCPFLMSVLIKIKATFCVSGWPGDVRSIWSSWSYKRIQKKWRPTWFLSLAAFFWVVWRERNN